MSSEMNRRNFIKAAVGATGAAGLAGCNSLGDDSDPNQETDDQSDQQTDEPTDNNSTPEANYSIQASPLEYDLTSLAANDANQHDQAYVEDNYSAELGITVLNNGEEADLEELSDVHLENEEGKRVETTEEGYVPEYAVEDGQELTVRAEIDGETLEETVTVNKQLPSEFYADARIQENGEVVYETGWDTPYSFDNHIVNRQVFLDQRAERRDELADNEVITEDDLRTFKENIEFVEQEFDLTEDEMTETYLRLLNSAMKGGSPGDFEYEGSGNTPNSFNVERALEEHTDFDPNYVGSFWNPREPDVPTSADGDGLRVRSQVAHVGDDWFHNGEDNITASHISEVDEIEMAKDVEDEPAQYLAVSVLGEFERGNTDIDNPDDASYFVQEAVTSPVTLNDNLAEIELSDDISWNALNQIRANNNWEDVMVPMELATAVGTDVDGSVEMEGETLQNSKIKISE